MSTPLIVRGTASAVPLACLLLSLPATAGQLSLDRFLNYDLIAPRDNVVTDNSSSCDTCTLLQGGLDTTTVPYVATYDRPGTFPDFEPFTTTATHSATSGGSVGYGFIRGFVSASLETDQAGAFPPARRFSGLPSPTP